MRSILLIRFNILSLTRPTYHFQRFYNWIQEHQIVPESINQTHKLFNNWIKNDLFINETNNLNLSYTLAHNIYSGMDLDEFINVTNFNTNSGFLKIELDLQKNYNVNKKVLNHYLLIGELKWL